MTGERCQKNLAAAAGPSGDDHGLRKPIVERAGIEFVQVVRQPGVEHAGPALGLHPLCMRRDAPAALLPVGPGQRLLVGLVVTVGQAVVQDAAVLVADRLAFQQVFERLTPQQVGSVS